MTFEEIFKSWTLEQKVEWALGPNICNLSENMRSIIVDLKAENERLKGELKQTEAQDQVVIDGLRNEIERLKYALKQRTAQSDANVNLWMKELKRGAVQEKEIEQLRKDNAKLKCLALHLFKCLAYHEYRDWGSIRDGFAESKLKERCVRNADRWRRINERCYEAYRKAKESLKEEK